MKYLYLLLATTLFTATSYAQSETVWETYGENIEYKNFSSINFKHFSRKTIQTPYDLDVKVHQEYKNIRNEDRFQSELQRLFEKLQVSDLTLSKMSLKAALIFSLKTLPGFALNYKKDDLNHVMLSIEQCMEYGTGDCDEYTFLAKDTFNYIKDRLKNPNLRNAYVLRGKAGGRDFGNIGHDWVAIILLDKNKLIFSHVDPTFADNGEDFEADDYHLSTVKSEMLVSFYHYLEDSIAVYNLINSHPNVIPTGEKDREEFYIELCVFNFSKNLRFMKPEELPPATQFMKMHEDDLGLDSKKCMYKVLYELALLNRNDEEADIYYQKMGSQYPGELWELDSRRDTIQNEILKAK